MKKAFIFLFTGLVLLSPVTALEISRESGGEPVVCGPLFFIRFQEPYRVLIDGEARGTTPLLLPGLTGGRHSLRLEGETEFHVIDLTVNASDHRLYHYIPGMEKYSGRLSLETNPPGADIWLENSFLGTSPLTAAKIPTGTRVLKIFYPGYSIEKIELEVRRDSRETLALELTPLHELTIEPPLKGEMMLLCANETERLSFQTGTTCLLGSGTWQVTLKAPGMITETREITLKGPETLVFQAVHFDSCLVFTNLQPGSLVSVDFKDVTPVLEGNTYLLSAGRHHVSVHSSAYLTFQRTVDVLEDRETLVEIQYIKNPRTVKRSRQKAAWISLGIGTALFATGAVFNTDEVAVNLSQGQYSTYEMIKYGSLGGLGAGIMGIGAGLWILFTD